MLSMQISVKFLPKILEIHKCKNTDLKIKFELLNLKCQNKLIKILLIQHAIIIVYFSYYKLIFVIFKDF